MKTLYVLLIAGAAAHAQPSISANGIVNAASYLPGIAQGSTFVVFGKGLGPAQLQQGGRFPLPTTLAGTSVSVSQGPTTRSVPLVYTSAGQIAAVLPSDTPTGTNTLTVTYNGQTSAAAGFQVVRSQFGAFTTNSRGSGPVIALNFISQADQPRNALSQAANPDQVVTIYGTGLGPITSDDAGYAPVGDLDVNLEVLVGTQAARILYKGRSSCCAGIDQIVFAVPRNVEGCYVPLTIRATGTTAAQTSTLSVAPTGRLCTEPGLLSLADIEKARVQGNLRVGSMLLASYEYGGGQSIDYGLVSFSRTRYDDLVKISERLNAAPVGACEAASIDSSTGTTVGSIGNIDADFFDNYLFWYDGAPLDAGSNLTISGGGKSVKFQQAGPGLYSNALYDYSNPQSVLSPFLGAGSYTFDNGSGTTDIPAFRTTINVAAPIRFTIPTTPSISRNSDYAVTWTGGSPDQRILAYGVSYSQQGRVAGVFTCVQRGNTGKLVVPASVLGVLPPSGSIETGDGGGLIYLYSFSPYQRSDVPGLDAFYTGILNLSYRLAKFQ